MKEMADSSTICSHFKCSNLTYFIFNPKSQNLINDVVGHLPFTAPAEDILDGLVDLGFDVISAKQISATLQSPAKG
jgi:hypothetical protein